MTSKLTEGPVKVMSLPGCVGSRFAGTFNSYAEDAEHRSLVVVVLTCRVFPTASDITLPLL